MTSKNPCTNLASFFLEECGAFIRYTIFLISPFLVGMWGLAVFFSSPTEYPHFFIGLLLVGIAPIILFSVPIISPKLATRPLYLVSLVTCIGLIYKLSLLNVALKTFIVLSFVLAICAACVYQTFKENPKNSTRILMVAYLVFSQYIFLGFLSFMGSSISFMAVNAGPFYIKTIEYITPTDFFDTPHRVEFISSWKERPVVYVCRTKNLDSLKYLISRGYKLEKPEDPFKCFFHAIINENYEIIDYILSLPAEQRPSDKDIKRAFDSYPDITKKSQSLRAYKEKLVPN